MRTVLKVVDNLGKKGDMHTSFEGEEMCKIGRYNSYISPSKWKSQERKGFVWFKQFF